MIENILTISGRYCLLMFGIVMVLAACWSLVEGITAVVNDFIQHQRVLDRDEKARRRP